MRNDWWEMYFYSILNIFKQLTIFSLNFSRFAIFFMFLIDTSSRMFSFMSHIVFAFLYSYHHYAYLCGAYHAHCLPDCRWRHRRPGDRSVSFLGSVRGISVFTKVVFPIAARPWYRDSQRHRSRVNYARYRLRPWRAECRGTRKDLDVHIYAFAHAARAGGT